MQSRQGSLPAIAHLVLTVLAVGLLVFSWCACYLWLMGMTEGWGAPWDTAPIRPPVGNWQRTINDFFESGIGMYLPTIIVLGMSGLLYLITLTCTRAIWVTSIVFGATNLASLAVLLAVAIPMRIFLIRTPGYLTPQDWSYWGDFTREWPLSLMALIVFAGLLFAQPCLVGYLARRIDRNVSSNPES